MKITQRKNDRFDKLFGVYGINFIYPYESYDVIRIYIIFKPMNKRIL